MLLAIIGADAIWLVSFSIPYGLSHLMAKVLSREFHFWIVSDSVRVHNVFLTNQLIEIFEDLWAYEQEKKRILPQILAHISLLFK